MTPRRYARSKGAPGDAHAKRAQSRGSRSRGDRPLRALDLLAGRRRRHHSHRTVTGHGHRASRRRGRDHVGARRDTTTSTDRGSGRAHLDNDDDRASDIASRSPRWETSFRTMSIVDSVTAPRTAGTTSGRSSRPWPPTCATPTTPSATWRPGSPAQHAGYSGISRSSTHPTNWRAFCGAPASTCSPRPTITPWTRGGTAWCARSTSSTRPVSRTWAPIARPTKGRRRWWSTSRASTWAFSTTPSI